MISARTSCDTCSCAHTHTHTHTHANSPTDRLPSPLQDDGRTRTHQTRSQVQGAARDECSAACAAGHNRTQQAEADLSACPLTIKKI